MFGGLGQFQFPLLTTESRSPTAATADSASPDSAAPTACSTSAAAGTTSFLPILPFLLLILFYSTEDKYWVNCLIMYDGCYLQSLPGITPFPMVSPRLSAYPFSILKRRMSRWISFYIISRNVYTYKMDSLDSSKGLGGSILLAIGYSLGS